MAFENTKAEIALLMSDLQRQEAHPDRHELYLEILQKLNELKAYGMPLPADLVELERRLEEEFAAEQRAARDEQRRRQKGPEPRSKG